MGIKFHCPNGHKLNVKSFLAGKRGICPKCNVRMRIPMESEQEEGKAVVADPAPKKVAATATESVQTASPISSTAVLDDRIESLLEDRERVWHMTSADGEQFGPAAGDEVRQWLAQDRINSACHLWCDSWDDWRAAGDIFAGLEEESAKATPAIVSEPAPDEDAPFSDIDPFYLQDVPADSVVSSSADNPFGSLIQTEPAEHRSGPRRRRAPKGASPVRAAVMGVVALACLVTLGIVIYIAFQ